MSLFGASVDSIQEVLSESLKSRQQPATLADVTVAKREQMRQCLKAFPMSP